MIIEVEPGVISGFWARCGQAITTAFRDIKCLYLVMRHPKTPWHVRMVLFLPVAYVCSPIQLLPNFVPIIGQLDDLFVIWIANRLLERLVSEQICQECREAVGQSEFIYANDKFAVREPTG